MIGDVVAFIGHDPPDDVAELAGDGGYGHEVVLLLGAFAQPELSQISFLIDGAVGHLPERVAQEGAAAFADPAPGRVKLAALIDGGIQAGEGP